MEISPINWLAGIAFGLVFLVVIVRRWWAVRGELLSEIGWAVSGGLGAAGFVKATYPIYFFVWHRTIDVKAIDDLWLYVYGGSLAILFVGLDAIKKSWKTK